MRWPQLVACTLLGAALLWALWHYGATETWARYGLLLALLPPALFCCVAFPRARSTIELRLFLLAGVWLLARTALAPPLAGEGFVLLACGWLALFIAWALASGSLTLASTLRFLLVVAAAGEALLGLIQAAGVPIADSQVLRDQLGATGTFVNRNHFAALLNMGLPLALGALVAGWARRRASKAPRSEVLAWGWMMVLGCSLLGLAVLLSRSRGGILTLAATLVFLAVVLLRARTGATGTGASEAPASGRPASGTPAAGTPAAGTPAAGAPVPGARPDSLPVVAIGLLFALVLGLGLALGPRTFLERFAQVGESGQSRMTLYRDTLGLIAEHPILGVGPGMYRWRFRAHQTQDFEHRYDHAHNDYLESAAEWGVPAAIVFWGFVFWRLHRALQLFGASRTRRRRGLALGTAGAIASIAVHSLVDFNLQIPANWTYFCAVLGLAWGLEQVPSRRRARS